MNTKKMSLFKSISSDYQSLSTFYRKTNLDLSSV